MLASTRSRQPGSEGGESAPVVASSRRYSSAIRIVTHGGTQGVNCSGVPPLRVLWAERFARLLRIASVGLRF